MKMKFTSLVKLLLTTSIIILGHNLIGSPNDSLGVVKKNGKTYIEHKVDAGNTLYSLSKRYKVSIDDIKKVNPSTELKTNTKILIPFTRNSISKIHKYHTVLSGETLYSISKHAGISLDQLKSYNKLTNNRLSLGQKLIIGYSSSSANTSKNNSNYTTTQKEATKHVVKPGETLYSIARKHNVSLERIQRKNAIAYGNISPGDTLLIPERIKSLETKTLTMYNSTSKDLDPNLAEIISPVGEVGSIVKIQSNENKKVIYARVIKHSSDEKVYGSKKVYLLLGLDSFSIHPTITYVK